MDVANVQKKSIKMDYCKMGQEYIVSINGPSRIKNAVMNLVAVWYIIT